MGDETYNSLLRSSRGMILPENHPLTLMVDRVSKRLIAQAPIEGANWKVHVIKDPTANAFVLPGYVCMQVCSILVMRNAPLHIASLLDNCLFTVLG